MPSKSPAQAKLMEAVAHGWRKPGGGGPPPSVAKEFVAADERKPSRRKGASRNRQERAERKADTHAWTRTVHANMQDF
jgi:hypothetical protein